MKISCISWSWLRIEFPDSASIQLSSSHNTPNHHSTETQFKQPMSHNNPQQYLEYHHVHHQEIPKRAMLATVRSGRSRAGCRQGPVKQMLVDPSLCPQHCHGPPIVTNCALGETIIMTSDTDEGEEGEDNEFGWVVFDIYDYTTDFNYWIRQKSILSSYYIRTTTPNRQCFHSVEVEIIFFCRYKNWMYRVSISIWKP